MNPPDVESASTVAGQLRARLESALAPIEMHIEDESAQHAGHEGAKSGGRHFRLTLVSAAFAGLPKLARHRLVYHAAGPLMQREIHALAMSLYAPDELRGA
jgi:BolA family transcriptional regulator, general stress-responsive regulator